MARPDLTDGMHRRPVDRRDLRWLYGFLRPRRPAIAALVLLSLLASVLALLQPWLTKLIIDDGLLAGDFRALLLYSGGLLVLAVGATGLRGVNRIWHTRLSGSVLFALREDVYAHLQQLSPEFFTRQRSGDLISRMDRDIAEIQRFAVDTLFAAFSGIVGIVGTCAMMVLLSWKLALVLLVVAPLEFAYLKYMRPRVEQRNRRLRERGADITSFLMERVPAIKFIQSAGSEQRESERLAVLNRSFLLDLVSLQKTEFWTSAVPGVLLSSARAAVFLLGGYWVIEGQLALGSLIAFSAYLGMALGPVQTLLGLYMAWQRLRVSLERVSYIRRQPLPPRHTAERDLAAHCRGTLVMDGLCFGYGKERPVLSDIDLEIPAGSKVGLCGPTGAGKTTLLDLLQRHLQPDRGCIRFDGVDIEEFDLAQWRRKVAVVPQDPVVFRDTLANNISYCVPDASEEQILEAARAAGLRELVDNLPQGIHSLIAERGLALSGGERQRIGLARALLQQPAVLLLDEPTSAVDQNTENRLLAEVDRIFADTTRIVVSHRPSALAEADLLVTLKDGQLAVEERRSPVVSYAV